MQVPKPHSKPMTSVSSDEVLESGCLQPLGNCLGRTGERPPPQEPSQGEGLRGPNLGVPQGAGAPAWGASSLGTASLGEGPNP